MQFSNPSGLPYFCVVGDPVAHSKSPVIHHAFAAECGIDLVYDRVQVAAGDLAAAVEAFRAIGGRGMNVTVPLKEEAAALARHPSARVKHAGAANTLWFNDAGELACDNTDGIGLVTDLQVNHGVHLAGRAVLVLGAGGAVRGALPAILETGPATVMVSNRTRSRAESLCADLAENGELSVVGWGEVPAVQPDIVINGTAASLGGALPAMHERCLHPALIAYDMMYSNEPTAFVAWLREAGAALVTDGLGMLVEQAAEGFRIWHGVRPATAPVIAELRGQAWANQPMP